MLSLCCLNLSLTGFGDLSFDNMRPEDRVCLGCGSDSQLTVGGKGPLKLIPELLMRDSLGSGVIDRLDIDRFDVIGASSVEICQPVSTATPKQGGED